MKLNWILFFPLAFGALSAFSQTKIKAEDTEFYEPIPKVVKPGKFFGDAPSDAIILFDGQALNKWVLARDRSKPADWTVQDGYFTVKKESGDIETIDLYRNFQLHVEWKIPTNITGSGQGRGNSGIFLGSTRSSVGGYELQVLDAYQNKTYVNGMAGSIYKQYVPLANPARKPGEWQSYDVIWMAPIFNADSTLASPARATVFFNGVLVQNNVPLKGETPYIGLPQYHPHGPLPIKLQAHGDHSEPISYRNIWLREL